MTFKLPVGVLAQHVIVLGKTRSGKSTTVRVLVEGLLDADKPVCILDPKGDWWGIKSSADGKKAGYPLVIFGGEHPDVPINEHSGAAVAELIATGNRSCLIDLGGWMVGERTRFFVAFASTLFKLTRGARHLVIDEVHNFAPQGKILDPDAGKMLHWANRLASEGLGKGLVILAASQRPQKVHKDFLTSCETLIAKQVIHKLDRDAIKDWIDGCADPLKGKEVMGTLAQLKKPQAWIWSPEVDYGPTLVEIPLFKTYDSFKPQPADAGKLAGWAEVDLDQVKTKLAAVVEEAKANDPKELKRQIAELQRQIKATPVPEGAYLKRDIDHAFYQGKQEGVAEAVRANEVGFSEGWKKCAGDVRHHLSALLDKNTAFITGLEAAVAVLSNPPPTVKTDRREHYTPALRDIPPLRELVRQAPPPRRLEANLPRARVAANGHDSITGVQQRILDAMVELEQMGAAQPDRELVAFMAGYSNVTSKGFANAIGSLRTQGMIEYPSTGSITVTDAGREYANPPERARTPTELQDRIIGMLGGASARVLRPLINAYPKSIERQALAEAAGYGNVTSKGFANAIGRFRSLGFIDYPDRGTVVAKPLLFLE